VGPGDLVDFIAVAKGEAGEALSRPHDATFRVVGTLTIGGQLDSALGFCDLGALAAATGRAPNTIHLLTPDLDHALEDAFAAAQGLPERLYVDSWYSSQGKLRRDIEMVRSVMYLAMIAVMGVACFNIIGNLTMRAAGKGREIAILLTMGARRRTIALAFATMGLWSGLRGIVPGLAIGCALAHWLTPIMRALEALLGTRFLNPEIYFIDFIPSQLRATDALLVAAVAVTMSLAASAYPAARASSIRVVTALGG
ncbi:MAG: FtsX-like permease family protein, partial [Succinivibrionaceae bacterium]|nr:FtsX-like permease family protein [Succinivibrionaceae bacterium]